MRELRKRRRARESQGEPGRARESRGFPFKNDDAPNEEFILNKELKWRQVGCKLSRRWQPVKSDENASSRSKNITNNCRITVLKLFKLPTSSDTYLERLSIVSRAQNL